uniref:Transposon related predicted protein n=1 Tax=Brassica oleracea var. alboglabra TaxID=3714 RepID=B4YPW5_BRAOA|nr:transposon related predicted protein [Brassica oleracea var. alboglabra]
MSSSNYFRSWIDRPHLDPNTRLLTEEYQRGITEFMGLVHRQPEAKTGMLRCPCSNCKNRKVIKEWDVWTHLYLSGFTRSYKIWYHHGETDYEHGSTSEPQPAVRLEHYKKTSRILREKIVGISSEYRYSDAIPTKYVVGNNSSEFLFSSEIPRNFPTEFRGNKFPRKFRGSLVCRKSPRNIPR